MLDESGDDEGEADEDEEVSGGEETSDDSSSAPDVDEEEDDDDEEVSYFGDVYLYQCSPTVVDSFSPRILYTSNFCP